MKPVFYLLIFIFHYVCGSVKDDVLELIKNQHVDSALSMAERELIQDPGNIFLINILGKYSPNGHKSAIWLEKAVNSLAERLLLIAGWIQTGQIFSYPVRVEIGSLL